MTTREAITLLADQLRPLYGHSESSNIAQLVIEHITGFDRTQTITKKEHVLSSELKERIKNICGELLTHKPVQYVLGEAWFMGMRFYVDENVLIPRPETEELVDLIIKRGNPAKILDIGTGSGCIAVALKRSLPSSEVYAIDISEKALAVATRNALHNGVEISTQKVDILKESEWGSLPPFDFIVSNPPYIPSSERNSLRSNVINFEPHTALFVPENDPLIFYKQIVRFAESKNAASTLFFEIHEDYGRHLANLFTQYHPELKKDLQGKDRMLILQIINKM